MIDMETKLVSRGDRAESKRGGFELARGGMRAAMTERGREGKVKEGRRREARCHRAHTNGHKLRAMGAEILYLISEYTGGWIDIHRTLSHI